MKEDQPQTGTDGFWPSDLLGQKDHPLTAKGEKDINDLTYQINGAVFEANKELGSGFLEKVYENALLAELQAIGLKAES
jgi:hypothetical protein